MLFWIVAALLTLAASLAVLMPLAKANRAQTEGANEVEVYRDQLDEVDRDLKRGLLADAEAEQARAEIGRRIIRADEQAKAASEKGGLSGLSRIVAAAAVISVPLVSWALYGAIGSPQLPSQPLAERSCNPATSTVLELVACAERHLAKSPDDLRGWETLAPIYVRMGKFGEAINAYQNAIRVGGSSAARLDGLGEALTYAAGGTVTADARKAFEAAIAAEPGNPKARFFLAMAINQDGKRAEAENVWREMAAALPADNPWRGAAASMLADGAPKEETQPQPEVPAQPPAGQMAQIEQMVAGLDQRLRDDANDIEGWKRLVRSYVVLGKQDKAQDALKRALTAFAPDSAEAKDITAFAAEQGIKAQ